MLRTQLIKARHFSGLSAKSPTTKLVLLRHGESTWNKLNLFTGW